MHCHPQLFRRARLSVNGVTSFRRDKPQGYLMVKMTASYVVRRVCYLAFGAYKWTLRVLGRYTNIIVAHIIKRVDFSPNIAPLCIGEAGPTEVAYLIRTKAPRLR